MSKPNKSIFDFFKKEEEVKVTFAEVTTIDGIVLQYDGELAVDTPVFVLDEAGEQLPAPEGQYQVDVDGVITIISVDAQGVVNAVELPSEEEETMTNEVMSKEEFSLMTEKIISDIDVRFKALEDKFNELANVKESKFKDDRKKVEVSKEAMSVADILKSIKK
jgi:flagellar basal body rod protein FlgG